tara:strand:+ start:10225 stop:10608 length:384 start_codon:yes stop_codon:yes gene_type:complete
LFANETDPVALTHHFKQKLMTERQVLTATYEKWVRAGTESPDTSLFSDIQRQIMVIVGISCSFYVIYSRLMSGKPNGTLEMMFDHSSRQLSARNPQTEITDIADDLNRLRDFANSMLENAERLTEVA